MITIAGHTIDEVMLPKRPLALDVGSRNYGFAKGLLAVRPRARVICIEPDPAAPEPDDSHLTLIRKAMTGLARKTAPYCHYSTGEGNYLAVNDWFTPNPGEIMEVPCITIQELLRELGLWTVNLVKLDCEGEEFSILENWPVPPLSSQVSVEFHDFTSLRLHDAYYYAGLFTRLHHYRVRKHELSPIGPGKAMGHWDSLLTL